MSLGLCKAEIHAATHLHVYTEQQQHTTKYKDEFIDIHYQQYVFMYTCNTSDV